MTFMDKIKNNKSTKLISGVLTLAIISVLLLSGPAQAITLGIKNLDSTASEGSSVTFNGLVDIHSNDRIPLTNVTVLVKDGDSVAQSCSFDLSGSNDCSDFSINAVTEKTSYSNESGYGYGYGYDSGNYGFINQSFGYGYSNVAGYGYDSFQTDLKADAEFVYEITWNTPSVDSDKSYSIELKAEATGGSNSATYKTQGSESITIEADDGGGSSGGGGGGTGTEQSETHTPTPTQLQQGYSQQLSAGDEVQFTSAGGSHSMQIDEVGEDWAKITVQSSVFTNTLNVGEEWKIDLNENGTKDVSVKLDSIIDGSAKVTLTSLEDTVTTPEEEEEETTQDNETQETPDEGTEEENQTEENVTEEPKEETTKRMNLAWIAIGIIAALAIIIAIVVIVRKKK